MTTAADRPPLPRRRPRNPRTVSRSDIRTTLEHFTHCPGVWAVELALKSGEVTRMVVHHESGSREELTIVEGEA